MAGNEVLVALLRDKKDFGILQTEGWYRIPVQHTPKRWPPEYIAFYQPKAFGPDAFLVSHFARVARITQVERRVLFPNQLDSAKSGRLYQRIEIEALESLAVPILGRAARRVVFIPTTWAKFNQAVNLNDLFDDSPLEDALWAELKRRKLHAERQWLVTKNAIKYFLDFAFFCNRGALNVETDGDAWHLEKDRVAYDNRRNNDLAALGWHVLRFNTRQVQEESAAYCLPQIESALNQLGGLSDDGLVPRQFVRADSEDSQQLNLFEERAEYTADEDAELLD